MPAAPLPSSGTPCRLNDLMDALVAEMQGFGDFTQRPTAQVQATHGTVEFSAGHLGFMLCLNEPPVCAPRAGRQLLLHVV
jgi:hypothetical protein